MMFFIATFLMLVQAIACFSDVMCPAPEDLQPCYCVSDGKNIRVDCMQVNSVDELRGALQSLKGTRNIFIDFMRTRLGKIPSDLFKGLHVSKLSFANCDIEQFGDNGRTALEGLENSILELTIQFSFLQPNELKLLNVSRLRVIEELEIEGNEVSELGNDWFMDGPTSLKNLFVMTNYIQKLGDEAFASLINLRNLWLTGNRFRTLKRSMLPSPATYLTSLDLTDNEISSLPTDLFTDMPSLKEVVLSDNSIQVIAEDMWSDIWSQLTRVYLESNPIKCDDVGWMFKQMRPYVVKAKCVSPREYEGVEVKKIIDDKKREEDFEDY